MALHELATNAAKYGALSNDAGNIRVEWSIDGDHLVLRWEESGGPAVVAPTAKGFGSILIERATDGQAQIEFAPEGVRCTLNVSIKE